MTTETRRPTPAMTEAYRAWQDGITTMLAGYNRQASQLSSGIWGMRIDPTQVRETVRRIAAETRELTSAQVAVTSEWMRVPFWLTGTASPTNLQNSYSRLFQAYGKLVAAYFAAATPAKEAAERGAETATGLIDTQVKTTRTVAEEIATAQTATATAAVEAVATGAARVARTTASAVDQAIEVAEQETARATKRLRTAARSRPPIKGHVSSGGEKIYHLPRQSSYERTQANETFTTEEEAQAAGYRRAETPGGGTIKGKVARDGTRIYHLLGQANYDRFDADMLFESEEAAQAAGFRAAQR